VSTHTVSTHTAPAGAGAGADDERLRRLLGGEQLSNVTGFGSPRNSCCPRFWPTWPTWPTGTPGRGRRPRRPGAASNPPA